MKVKASFYQTATLLLFVVAVTAVRCITGNIGECDIE
jgi:hypothetical protein